MTLFLNVFQVDAQFNACQPAVSHFETVVTPYQRLVAGNLTWTLPELLVGHSNSGTGHNYAVPIGPGENPNRLE